MKHPFLITHTEYEAFDTAISLLRECIQAGSFTESDCRQALNLLQMVHPTPLHFPKPTWTPDGAA